MDRLIPTLSMRTGINIVLRMWSWDTIYSIDIITISNDYHQEVKKSSKFIHGSNEKDKESLHSRVF